MKVTLATSVALILVGLVLLVTPGPGLVFLVSGVIIGAVALLVRLSGHPKRGHPMPTTEDSTTNRVADSL